MENQPQISNSETSDLRVTIPSRIYFRIGDVADILGVKPYVIRFWESEFPFLAPDKAASGQRVYRRSQIESLILVKHLLHVERYSIEGARKKLTELRKQAKLKEAMSALVKGEAKAEPKMIGSVVEKSEVDALKNHLEDLQNLIRQPSVRGIPVRGLKDL